MAPVTTHRPSPVSTTTAIDGVKASLDGGAPGSTTRASHKGRISTRTSVSPRIGSPATVAMPWQVGCDDDEEQKEAREAHGPSLSDHHAESASAEGHRHPHMTGRRPSVLVFEMRIRPCG